MLRTACSFVFACALAAAVPVASQDAAPADLAAALVPAVPTAPGAPLAPKVSRPAALVPLYAGFATLQALDYASTMRALANGAGAEANPMMRSIVKNPPAFIALKAAATAGVIVVGEKMWKKNRVGAVLFVAGANAAMAIAVGRNYAVR